MNPNTESVTVLGAGAWGTALADLMARSGHEVRVWCYEEEVARSINRDRTCEYLPDVELGAMKAFSEFEPALRGADLVVSAVPCQFVRGVLERAAVHLSPAARIVGASKGIELSTQLRMSELFSSTLTPARHDFAVISGPSFAAEVASGTPTAVVVASESTELAARIQRSMQTNRFRVYTSTDVVGVELAGALKNVIAIAAGIVVGLGYGHNTMAALVSRGLAEITRLGVSMGADAATFAGLAGMGDLLLTCTGPLSRNRGVGVRLGEGESLAAITAEMKSVAEGVRTVEAVVELAARQGVEMPISEQVHRVAHRGRAPAAALDTLMERSPRPEEW